MKITKPKLESPKLVAARASFVRTSPRKLRLVARAISGLTPDKAIAYLQAMNKRAAIPIARVIKQALANAKNNFQISPGNLIFETVQILEGPRGAKRLDKGHGARFDRGLKRRRLAHILVKLKVKS